MVHRPTVVTRNVRDFERLGVPTPDPFAHDSWSPGSGGSPVAVTVKSAPHKSLIRAIYRTFIDSRDKPVRRRVPRRRMS